MATPSPSIDPTEIYQQVSAISAAISASIAFISVFVIVLLNRKKTNTDEKNSFCDRLDEVTDRLQEFVDEFYKTSRHTRRLESKREFILGDLENIRSSSLFSSPDRSHLEDLNRDVSDLLYLNDHQQIRHQVSRIMQKKQMIKNALMG